MYFKSKNLKLKKPMFKKRFLRSKEYKYKKKLYIYSFRTLLELNFIKKHLVNFYRFVNRKKVRIYIYIKKNYLISAKSKNSRMGKGKGKTKRFIYKNKLCKGVLFFSNISEIRLPIL